ncbi:MAG: hypothetical protein WD046_10270 [Paracoccaceae bacterium]
MDNDKNVTPTEKITDLEMVHWVDEQSSMRGMAKAGGKRPEKTYESFQELYDAILKDGTLVFSSPVVDVVIFAPEGRFEGHLIAVRHSGRNVRKFLIRADLFDDEYGNFSNCLDHIRSNNAADCELELTHLQDLADQFELSPTTFDRERVYGRLEIDIVAALQFIKIVDDLGGGEGTYPPDFELGYCVGRLFSSIQNLATLEPDAVKAHEYEKSYKDRGKKGKSRDRKEARQDQLFECIERLVSQNPALSRFRPLDVAKLACKDAMLQNSDLWTQGSGQLEQYLTCFASEPKYRKAYRDLFPETG